MAEALTILTRLHIVQHIEQDDSGATLHFRGARPGRLSVHDVNYASHLQLGRRSEKRQHPVGVTFGDGRHVTELVRADNNVPVQLRDDAGACVRVFFQGHDGVFRLKPDHPEHSRLRAMLEEAIRNHTRLWFIAHNPDLTLMDVAPAACV